MANLIIGSQDPLAKQAELISENANSIVLAQSIATVATTPGANNVTVSTSVNNDSGDTVTVYTTPGTISVSSVDQTINQYLVSDSGVSSIVAGNNVTITSSAGNGQGTVTINATVGTVNTVATANTVINNAQPNITSVGTLTSLGVSGTIISANVIANTGIFSGNGSGLSNLPASNLTGNLSNLTSLFIGNGSLSNSAIVNFGANSFTSTVNVNTYVTFYDSGGVGQTNFINYVRTFGNLNSPTTPNNNSSIGQSLYRIYNGTQYPTAGKLYFYAPNASSNSFSGNVSWTPGGFVVQTGNPSGNVTNPNSQSAYNLLYFNEYGQFFVINGGGANGSPTASLGVTCFTNVAGDGSDITLSRARGNRDSYLPVQSGDTLGNIFFRGYNGTSFRESSRLISIATSNASVTPGSLIAADFTINTIEGNIYIESILSNGATNPLGNVYIGNGITNAQLIAGNVFFDNMTLSNLSNSSTGNALFYDTGTGQVTYGEVGTLQGIQGITGAQGTTGSTGIQGTSGAIGIQGTTGSTGIQGTTGSTGIQGTSGAIGIQGTTGAIGIQGTTGAIGIQGTTGAIGIQGTTGSIGIQGTTGLQGIQSTQGLQGIQGIEGPTNANTLIWTSVPGTSNSTGTPGQVAYATGFFYVCVANNTWERATLTTW